MQYPVSRGYSTSQITLHWVIVALVFFQLVFGDAMSHSLRAIGRGEAVDPSVATQATLHIWVGFAILAAVAIRIVLRLTKGAPPLPDGSAIVALLARLTHAAFYFLLVAMPVTGILAYWRPARARQARLHRADRPACGGGAVAPVLAARRPADADAQAGRLNSRLPSPPPRN